MDDRDELLNEIERIIARESTVDVASDRQIMGTGRTYEALRAIQFEIDKARISGTVRYPRP